MMGIDTIFRQNMKMAMIRLTEDRYRTARGSRSKTWSLFWLSILFLLCIIFIIFLGMWLYTTHSIIVKPSMMCMLCKKEFANFFYLFVGCHWHSILLNSSRQLTFIVSTAFLNTKRGCYIYNGIEWDAMRRVLKSKVLPQKSTVSSQMKLL